MGYRVFEAADDELGLCDVGLEGPFRYPNGMVVYYDPAEGAYYNPRTDMYLSDDEIRALQESIYNVLRT